MPAMPSLKNRQTVAEKDTAKQLTHMRRVAKEFWPRVEKQASGELLNERVAAERAVERIMCVMREEIFPRWVTQVISGAVTDEEGDIHPEDVHVTLRQKDKIVKEVRECFKLCQLTNADMKLFDAIMDRLAPKLQHVEQKVEVSHNHVVMLPQTKSPEKWVEGEVVDDGH